MTQEGRGHYAAKHKDVQLDERIAAAIQKKVARGQLACPMAEQLAAEMGVTMAEIGRHSDLLEIRIGGCQLGLFGHATKNKSVRPAQVVSQDLETALLNRLAEDPQGRLPCAALWEIAALLGMPRLKVSAACEKLGIKIKPCQLGAF